MASDTGSYSLLTADLSLPSLKTLFYRRLVWPRGSSSCVTRSHPSRTANCSSTTSATSPSQVRVYLPTLPSFQHWSPNLVFVTTQQSQYSEDCTRLCHRNTENNSIHLHFSGAAIQFSSIYTFEEHYVQHQIILIRNKRSLLLVTGCPPPPRP